MFNQLEKYLIDFLEYVPLDFKHLNVYSLKLVTALLEIGPEIISSFDLAVFSCGVRNLKELIDDAPRKNRVVLLEKEKDFRREKEASTLRRFNDCLTGEQHFHPH